MSDNKSEEQVQGNPPSENQEAEQPVENETQEEEYDLKKLKEEIKATKEKLFRLKQMKRALMMKKGRPNKQKKVDDLDPDFQQPPENEQGPHPEFGQFGPPFPQNDWQGGPPPEMFYGYGPWRFHHKHNHCGKKEWKHHPCMHCPKKHPRCPPQWRQQPPPQQGDMPPPPPQGKHQKDPMKGNHKGWGRGMQMAPEWAYYYYNPYPQQYQEGDESSSYSYSGSGSENDNQ